MILDLKPGRSSFSRAQAMMEASSLEMNDPVLLADMADLIDSAIDSPMDSPMVDAAEDAPPALGGAPPALRRGLLRGEGRAVGGGRARPTDAEREDADEEDEKRSSSASGLRVLRGFGAADGRGFGVIEARRRSCIFVAVSSLSTERRRACSSCGLSVGAEAGLSVFGRSRGAES